MPEKMVPVVQLWWKSVRYSKRWPNKPAYVVATFDDGISDGLSVFIQSPPIKGPKAEYETPIDTNREIRFSGDGLRLFSTLADADSTMPADLGFQIALMKDQTGTAKLGNALKSAFGDSVGGKIFDAIREALGKDEEEEEEEDDSGGNASLARFGVQTVKPVRGWLSPPTSAEAVDTDDVGVQALPGIIGVLLQVAGPLGTFFGEMLANSKDSPYGAFSGTYQVKGSIEEEPFTPISTDRKLFVEGSWDYRRVPEGSIGRFPLDAGEDDEEENGSEDEDA